MLIGHFPWKPSSGLNAMNCFISVNLNCLLPKMMSLWKVPWEAVGLSATYAFCDFGSSAVSNHSFGQVLGLHCHSILAPHQNLLISLTSTPQCHRLQKELWDALCSHVVTLALWLSSSSCSTALRMTWWPSCTVSLEASICADLPAQLNRPPKWNSSSLALQ